MLRTLSAEAPGAGDRPALEGVNANTNIHLQHANFVSSGGAPGPDTTVMTTLGPKTLSQSRGELMVNRRMSASTRRAIGSDASSNDENLVVCTFEASASFDNFSASLTGDVGPKKPARVSIQTSQGRSRLRARRQSDITDPLGSSVEITPSAINNRGFPVVEAAVERARRAAAEKAPKMDLVPTNPPDAFAMKAEAVKDRGVGYPLGPWTEPGWIFSREPGPEVGTRVALHVQRRHVYARERPIEPAATTPHDAASPLSRRVSDMFDARPGTLCEGRSPSRVRAHQSRAPPDGQGPGVGRAPGPALAPHGGARGQDAGGG